MTPPSSLTPVVWSLGSNIGDSFHAVNEGLARLARHPQIELDAVSSFYRTTPVEADPQPDFINVTALGRTSLTPVDLVAAGLAIEAELGRVRTSWHGPRTLDIDVIAMGDLTVAQPQCTIPHPRASARAFVLVPWLEIDPNATLAGVPVVDLLAGVDVTGVTRLDEVIPVVECL